MTKRTGPARVAALASKEQRPTVVGGPDAMTDAAADAIEELIGYGRAVDAARRRERGSAR